MTRRAWMLFVAISLIWGLPYLFIKIAVHELSPLTVVVSRIVIALAILLPVALATGALRGLRPKVGWMIAFALAEFVVPWPLITAGEQRIPSSLAGLLVSTTPLAVAVLALRFDPGERVSGLRLVGLLTGFAGVALVVGIDAGLTAGQLLGALMVLLASLSYGVGAMVVKKRLSDANTLGVNALTLLFAALVLAPAAVPTLPRHLPSAQALAAVAVLGVVCTAAGLLIYFSLIAIAGASRATVITYLNPAVAVALGVAVLGEPVTAAMVAGFLLILAGSWLSTGGGPSGRAVLAALARRSRRGGRLPAGGRARQVPLEPAADPA